MTESTHNQYHQTRGRWLALAGILAAVAAVFTALQAWARLSARPLTVPLPQPIRVPAAQPTRTHAPASAVTVETPDVSPPASRKRVIGFLAASAILALLLVVLQNDTTFLSTGLFLLIIAGGVVVGIRRATPSGLHAPRLMRWPYQAGRAAIFWPLRLVVRVLFHFRYAFAALGGLSAAVLMALSAVNFIFAYHSFKPMDDAVQLLLGGVVVLGASIYLARPNPRLPTLAVWQTLAVPLHLNLRYTALGTLSLLLLSEINGKVLHRFYVIDATTHTQFAILVVGITLIALGMSGWQPAYRLPGLRWWVFLGGVVLVIASGLVKYATDPLPLIPAARVMTDSLLFWSSRIGTIVLIVGWLGIHLNLPRPSLSRRTVFIGAAGIVIMGLLAQPSVLGWLDENAGVWILALILAGAGLWFARRWIGGRAAGMIGGGLIGLAVVAHLSGSILINTAYGLAVDVRFWWILWLVIVGSVGASGVYDRVRAGTFRLPRFTITWRDLLTAPSLHYIALGLIIALGFATRFYLLNDATRFLIDEESFIGATHYLRVVPNMELLIPFSSIAAFPYVYPYWQMLAIDLFGKSLLGLRATSAILGALTVPALYFLARTLFDRKVALVAALLLATFPVHIHFSRIAIEEVSSPVFGILAFAFVARGLKHGRRVDYALAGVMLGVTHYFHEGGRLLFTPLTILWVLTCLILMPRLRGVVQSGGRGAMLRNVFITAAALIIVAAPIYYTLIATDRPLFARMVNNNSGLGGQYWQEVLEPDKLNEHINWHLLPAFQVYLFQIDNTRFYAGTDGLIPPFVVPFFLLGIFYAFWRPRSPGTLLLLLWVLTTSLGNSLMVDSAGSPRYVMVFPALMLAAAVGIRYTATLIARNVRRQTALIAVVTVVLAFAQVDYYFNSYLPVYNREFRALSDSPDGYDAALRSLDFPPGTSIHIISQNLVNQIETAGMIGLVRSDLSVDTLKPPGLTTQYFKRLQCRVDHAFFIERGDFNTLSKLREHFYLRAAQFTTNNEILPDLRLVLYYAPYIKGSEAVYGREC